MVYANFDEIITKVIQTYIDKGYRYTEGLAKLKDALKLAHNKNLNVGEQFEIVLVYYKPILQDKFDDWHLRLNDLETLRQIAMRYESLEQLLADFAIEPPEKGVGRVEPSVPEGEKPLTLSTIHSAKGLEWEVVFIIGLMDGVLPVSFALNDDDEIEEEHRLLYVGITRAKNNLFLSLHHEGIRGGINQFNKISRFVDVPNVLSKLEQKRIPEPKIKPVVTYKEAEKVTPIYDKKSLLRKVIEFLK